MLLQCCRPLTFLQGWEKSASRRKAPGLNPWDVCVKRSVRKMYHCGFSPLSVSVSIPPECQGLRCLKERGGFHNRFNFPSPSTKTPQSIHKTSFSVEEMYECVQCANVQCTLHASLYTTQFFYKKLCTHVKCQLFLLLLSKMWSSVQMFDDLISCLVEKVAACVCVSTYSLYNTP